MTGEPTHLRHHMPQYTNYCLNSEVYASLPAVFNLLLSSMNREVLEKQLCNHSMKNMDNFPLREGSHHVQPLNRHFSLSAKKNGTQRRST